MKDLLLLSSKTLRQQTLKQPIPSPAWTRPFAPVDRVAPRSEAKGQRLDPPSGRHHVHGLI